MASTVSFPSQPFHNFSLPPSKDSATTTNHFSTDNLSHLLNQTIPLVDKSTDSTESHHRHLATETSEMKPTASDDRPNIVIKFCTRSNNETDDPITARNEEEFCEKGETSEKRALASDDDPAVNTEEQTVAAATTKSKKDETSEKKSTASNSGSQTTDQETIVAKDGNVEENKKRKFSISLTKEEIEADMIAVGLGGLKRSRKIKKRPKSVQKLLENLFPGMHLESITSDDYRL